MDPGLSPMGARAVAVARQPIAIDRDTLRAALRTLPDESLRAMLERACKSVGCYLSIRKGPRRGPLCSGPQVELATPHFCMLSRIGHIQNSLLGDG